MACRVLGYHPHPVVIIEIERGTIVLHKVCNWTERWNVQRNQLKPEW
ncbi:MAG TPA: hypothetical protein GX009_05530 [Candidatus Atribacteria bacterium]|nr:hypothetical protein [Candidatus Atribacteria bacterium]